MDYNALKEDIRGWSLDCGFQALGVTDVNLAEHSGHVRDWLARGFNGEMGYMARNLDKRLQPDLLEPGTCRVISARMDYLAPDTRPIEVLESSDRAYVSRYALGRDYHKVLRRRLARLGKRISEALADMDHQFRAFTDSAPVLEKALGEKAGLGWIGKHSLLLNRSAGSWFFLGEIYTNVPLPVDEPHEDDHCGNCKACITVCPTGAIVGPKQLDARKCISYLTIEHKGAIPVNLRPLMGNRIYGCDDCQLYCPWNRDAAPTSETDFAVRHGLDAPALADLMMWSQAQFLQNTEGSAIRRVSYEQWLRNVAVALGNGPPTEAAFSALMQRQADASALVREHVNWALDQLQGRDALSRASGSARDST